MKEDHIEGCIEETFIEEYRIKEDSLKEDCTIEGREVLCGANAYEQKYYFNSKFSNLPKSIQKELNIVCVLFTEEVGGVLTFVFEEDGSISLETDAYDEDIYYDEIGAGLLVREIYRKRRDLMEQLSLYYRVMILNEDICEV